MQVAFVPDDDPTYRSVCQAMITEGKLAFRTCFRQAFIPVSYLSYLNCQAYNSDLEPKTVKDAVDHWLLTEIMGAIGSHTIL